MPSGSVPVIGEGWLTHFREELALPRVAVPSKAFVLLVSRNETLPDGAIGPIAVTVEVSV
jgi:hypothetical protein